MRPRRIVVGDPGANKLPGLIKIEEQALVEELVAHPASEIPRLRARSATFAPTSFSPAKPR